YATVTGVQTCALPICPKAAGRRCGGARPPLLQARGAGGAKWALAGSAALAATWHEGARRLRPIGGPPARPAGGVLRCRAPVAGRSEERCVWGAGGSCG